MISFWEKDIQFKVYFAKKTEAFQNLGLFMGKFIGLFKKWQLEFL